VNFYNAFDLDPIFVDMEGTGFLCKTLHSHSPLTNLCAIQSNSTATKLATFWCSSWLLATRASHFGSTASSATPSSDSTFILSRSPSRSS